VSSGNAYKLPVFLRPGLGLRYLKLQNPQIQSGASGADNPEVAPGFFPGGLAFEAHRRRRGGGALSVDAAEILVAC